MAKRTYTYDGSSWQGLASPAVSLSNYPNMTTTPISGFRNAIINGDFRIWQRGTSFTPSSSLIYTADRFFGYNSGNGSMTISRQSFTPGNVITGYEPQHYLRTAISSIGTSGYFNLGQRIEDVRTFAGQTVTVSFWMKSDANRSVSGFVYQSFGSGGSTATTTTYGPFNVTTSWQRFTATINLPSVSGKNIGSDSNLSVELNLPASIQTTDIWGIQVEKGTLATPFEQRPVGTELALCQRYYQSGATISSGWAFYNSGAGDNLRGTNITLPFKVTMRSSPTISVTAVSQDNFVLGSSWANADFINAYVRANLTGYPYGIGYITYTAVSEL
jgi:hypothetical protein